MDDKEKLTSGDKTTCPEGLCRFLERQTDAIDSLKEHILDIQRNQAEQQKDLWDRILDRLERIITHPVSKIGKTVVKFAAGGTASIASVIGGTQLIAYLYDLSEQKAQAAELMKTAEFIYYEENDPKLALAILAKASELHKNEAAYNLLQAYIEGMAAVRKIVNLDRPLNQSELSEAHQALTTAKFLENSNPGMAEAKVLKAQIYMALEDRCRASKALNDAKSMDSANPFVKLRLASMAIQSWETEGKSKAATIPTEITDLLNEIAPVAKKTNTDPSQSREKGNYLQSATIYLGKAWRHLSDADEDDYTQNVLAAQKKWAQLWYGVAFADIGKWNDAIEQYRLALESDPNFELARYNLGQAYLHKSPPDYVMARSQFERALTINPDSKDALFGLGMLYGYQDQYETAEAYFTKAIEKDGEFYSAWKWRAITRMDKFLQENGDRKVGKNGKKQLTPAFEDFNQALALNPNAFDIYTRRGKANMLIGDLKSAVRDLLLAEDLQENQDKMYFEQEREWNSQCPKLSDGAEDEAAPKSMPTPAPSVRSKRNIERNLDLRGERLKTRHYLGRAYARSNKVDLAEKAFLSAIEADETYLDVYLDLIDLMLRQDRPAGDIEKIYITAIDKTRQRKHVANYKYALFLLARQRHEDAIPRLKSALENRPSYSPALSKLSCALMQSGQKTLSDQQWSEFLSQRPDVDKHADRCRNYE